jgi:hypothetical protein
MFPAPLWSSSGRQLYEHNFWYNQIVLVAFQYAGPSRPAYRMATNTDWLYRKLYSNNCPLEDERKGARNM